MKIADLSDEAFQWLTNGERGASSNTLFTRATGLDVMDGDVQTYPRDALDFRRCRLLAEMCPEVRAGLNRVAEHSGEWSEIVRVWDDIADMMDFENPDWRTRAVTMTATNSLIYAAHRRSRA